MAFEQGREQGAGAGHMVVECLRERSEGVELHRCRRSGGIQEALPWIARAWSIARLRNSGTPSIELQSSRPVCHALQSMVLSMGLNDLPTPFSLAAQ